MTHMSAIKKSTVLILFCIITLLFFGRTSVAEEKDQFKWNLSLKISGGLRYITVGDINDHIESFDDYMSSAIAFYEGGKMEGVDRFGPYLEAELRIEVSPRLAIGLGTGYISGSNKSDFQTVGIFPFTSPTWTPHLLRFTIEPKVRAIPVRLGIYYSLPFASRANFLLHGGLGYYFSNGILSKYNSIVSLDEIIIPEQPEISASYDVSGRGFGVHGGIGLEYRLTHSLFLLIEVEGRYAKIGNLKGTLTYWNTWNRDQRIEEGTLFIGTRDMTDAGYGAGCPDLAVSPLPNMKKAALDFSGFSLTAGFRIRLF
jgi:opacity protein-like surface antigen